MNPAPILLDPAAFDPARADAGLLRLNDEIMLFQAARPSPWSLPLDAVRQARREGRGVLPLPPRDARARDVLVGGRGGHAIAVRVFHPSIGAPHGTYLHFHGGGWVFGEAAENDARLRRFADRTGLAVASVDYRLAPEHPFPAGPDDCEDAALALSAGALDGLPNAVLVIGGESAGAHLAVLTLIRLRDRHAPSPFRAAVLVAGCYDLAMTPSVRRFGPRRLVLNTEDVGAFVRCFVPAGVDLADPEVSPLHADLGGLPPALFTVGTRDLLLDDTLFMAARWLAAGNRAALRVQNGGCHVFEAFPTRAADASLAAMEAFVRGATAAAPAATERPPSGD